MRHICFLGILLGLAVVSTADDTTARNHWSFHAPQRSATPAVSNASWVRNPIDAFIADEQARHGLTPLPEAPKAILLRRVYLDLVGLTPTVDELHAFLADNSPDAYEKVVDRLLASPRYGERWGRHWMDVWRYSDWAGYMAEVRDSQPNIWRWRDWIVDSLNADKPYDQMVQEMLAGDEIAPEDPNTVRATGFLVRSWYKFNRNVWLDRVVEHTSKAFLGLTINCARCHDHKYDPISQQEYYKLRAVFEPYDIRTEALPGQIAGKAAEIVRAFDANSAAPTYLFVRGDEKSPETEHKLTAATPAILAGQLQPAPVMLPLSVRYPAMRSFVVDEMLAKAAADCVKAHSELTNAETAVAAAEERVNRDAVAVVPATMPAATTAPTTVPTTAPAGFVVDDFSIARPDTWRTLAGDWAYKDGHLLQSRTGATEYAMASLQDHPRNFTAEFRFIIRGGELWKSVGMSFDQAEDHSRVSVYLSAHEPEPKLQVAIEQNGSTACPPADKSRLPILVGKAYDLRVTVEEQFLTVFVNDRLELTSMLNAPRRPGKFSIWAFDATAEFLSLRIRESTQSSSEAQTTAINHAAQPAVVTLQNAQHILELDKARAATVDAVAAALKARIAAEQAKYETPPASSAAELATAASLAERTATLKLAEQKLREAQSDFDNPVGNPKPDSKQAAQTRPQLAKAVQEEQKKVDAAREALAKPSSTYTPLGPVYPDSTTGRRLALAKWITHRGNPLAARVAVNHMWMRHFGQALVPTVFDFGLNGKPPTLPALLDWLAVELMEPTVTAAPPWSMKRLHRLMVTSATYRMMSAGTGDSPTAAADEKADPDNHWLWRQTPRRMEAEAVRDSLLNIAGTLDPTPGGPELDEKTALTSSRRSLYFRQALEKQPVVLQVFDAPSPNECYRREQTVQPQQALALENSTLALASARLTAKAICRDSGADDPRFIVAAFERVLARGPTDAEREGCTAFLQSQAALVSDKGKLSPFVGGEACPIPPAADPAQRAREDLVHVLFNHNDFVTVR